MNDQEVSKEIIDKILKLLRLSSSSNENEASLAAQRASELLIKHNISIDEIHEDGSRFEKIDKNFAFEYKVNYWRSWLLSALSELNFCKTTVMNDGKEIYLLLGKTHNIMVTKKIFEYLEKNVKKFTNEYTKAYVEKDKMSYEMGLISERTWHRRKRMARNSIRLGIVTGLCERLQNKKEELMNKGFDNTHANGMALVIRDKYKSEEELIQEWLKRNVSEVKEKKQKSKDVDIKAFNLGATISNNIGIDPQINEN